MVSFQCHACGDTVKKPKLQTHYQRCHTGFDCIDCSKTFNTPTEFKQHTSCISEEEKYQKSVYKGPKKGDSWQKNGHHQNSNGYGGRGGRGGSRGGYQNGRGGRPLPRYSGTGANDTPLGTPQRMSPPDSIAQAPKPTPAAPVHEPIAETSKIEAPMKTDKSKDDKSEKKKKDKKRKHEDGGDEIQQKNGETSRPSKKLKDDDSLLPESKLVDGEKERRRAEKAKRKEEKAQRKAEKAEKERKVKGKELEVAAAATELVNGAERSEASEGKKEKKEKRKLEKVAVVEERIAKEIGEEKPQKKKEKKKSKESSGSDPAAEVERKSKKIKHDGGGAEAETAVKERKSEKKRRKETVSSH